MNFRLKKGIEQPSEQLPPARKYLYLGIALVGAVGIGAITTYSLTNNKKADNRQPYAATIEVKREACKLFTLDDAKKLIGNNATASSTNANAVTESVSTSLCSYSSGGSDASKLKVITVLVRSTNPIQAKQAYELSRAANATAIDDLTVSAYYNPDVSQLNLLKQETLVRIAATEGGKQQTNPDSSKSVAKIIIPRL